MVRDFYFEQWQQHVLAWRPIWEICVKQKAKLQQLKDALNHISGRMMIDDERQLRLLLQLLSYRSIGAATLF